MALLRGCTVSPSTDQLIRLEVEARGLRVCLAPDECERLEWEDFFVEFLGSEADLRTMPGRGAFGQLARFHGDVLARARRQESRRRRARWRCWLAYLRYRRVL
jgi:hypothetical protein